MEPITLITQATHVPDVGGYIGIAVVFCIIGSIIGSAALASSGYAFHEYFFVPPVIGALIFSIAYAGLMGVTGANSSAAEGRTDILAIVAEETHGIKALTPVGDGVACVEGGETESAEYTWVTDQGAHVTGRVSKGSVRNGQCEFTLRPITSTLAGS